MKKPRLDQILLRLGYATEDQIRHALIRQKANGERLGTHLLYLKFITEDQLVHALSQQHRVPAFDPHEHEISNDVVKKLPYELAHDLQVIPLHHDNKTGVLSVAAADPADTKGLTKIKRAFGKSKLKVYVAPESVLNKLIAKHYRGKDPASHPKQIVELPELFRDDPASPPDKGQSAVDDSAKGTDSKNVLIVSKSASLKNFLGPIFEREGFSLQVLSDPDEIDCAFNKERFDQILVAKDTMEEFSSWVMQGRISRPRAEVSVFSTVSSALLDNPIPYHRIIRSLFQSLQMIAEFRHPENTSLPPYVPMCKDLRHLAQAFGFRRVAVDGLQIAAWLLPSSDHRQATDFGPFALADFDKSIAFAKSLLFPWRVEAVLRSFAELLSGAENPDRPESMSQETPLAAQFLAVVWYRHTVLGETEEAEAVKTSLGQQGGRLASAQVVESYLRLLERHGGLAASDSYRQVFIVSRDDDLSRQFATCLSRYGYHTVEIDDLNEARHLCRRQSPTAILVHNESFPAQMRDCSHLFKLSTLVLMYAFTLENKPSLTLDLLDAGFHDVFVAPYDYDVIATRITKSLTGMSRAKGQTQKPGSFGATFEAFAFIDLIQALGQAQKTVHIRVSNGHGDTADIYMQRGKMVHAIYGRLSGEEAIYSMIEWGNDGEFTVEPEDDLPPPNIVESNEAILMEGCRLLDESKV